MEEIVAHNVPIKVSRNKKLNPKRVGLKPVNMEEDATVTVR